MTESLPPGGLTAVAAGGGGGEVRLGVTTLTITGTGNLQHRHSVNIDYINLNFWNGMKQNSGLRILSS